MANIKMAVLASAAFIATGAQADDLLLIDLSVVDQITITATAGLASATTTGSGFTGFLLADFYSGAGTGLISSLISGDITTAGTVSDGTPALFRQDISNGLNMWSFNTASTSNFTAGALAFQGSGTWSISSALYAEMLAGNSSGDIYNGADTDDDIANGAVLVGTWNTIPAPSSMALLGLGGVVAGRRRR